MPQKPKKYFNIAWQLKKSAKEDLEKLPVIDPTMPETRYPGSSKERARGMAAMLPNPNNLPPGSQEQLRAYSLGTPEIREMWDEEAAAAGADPLFPAPVYENNEAVDRSPIIPDSMDAPGGSSGGEVPWPAGTPRPEEGQGDNQQSAADPAAKIAASLDNTENSQALKSVLSNETLHGKLSNNQQVNKIPSDSGVLHQAIPQAAISWMQTPSEMRVSHNNAGIRMGPDMPQDELSGYGRDGVQHCDTIDLCAGYGQANNDGAGLEHGTITKNNIITDAARVYVSAITDIDENFGLADGTVGKSVGQSGIGIKADAVRIVGRQSIKIVTGKMRGTAETASSGAPLGGRAGIDLIAGNYTGSKKLKMAGGSTVHLQALQPAVMGDNLMGALQEVEDHIDQLRSAVLSQAISTTLCLAGMAPGLIPFAAPAAAPIPSAVRKNITDVILPMWILTLDQIFWKWKFLNAKTDRYICSRNIRLT